MIIISEYSRKKVIFDVVGNDSIYFHCYISRVNMWAIHGWNVSILHKNATTKMPRNGCCSFVHNLCIWVITYVLDAELSDPMENLEKEHGDEHDEDDGWHLTAKYRQCQACLDQWNVEILPSFLRRYWILNIDNRFTHEKVAKLKKCQCWAIVQ